MRGLRGTLAGALALAALQRLLSSDQASSRVGGLFYDIARLAQRALSPDVPTFGAVPASASTPRASSGTGTATLAPLPGLAPGIAPDPTPHPAPQVAPTPQIAPGWRPTPASTPATVYTA